MHIYIFIQRDICKSTLKSTGTHAAPALDSFLIKTNISPITITGPVHHLQQPLSICSYHPTPITYHCEYHYLTLSLTTTTIAFILPPACTTTTIYHYPQELSPASARPPSTTTTYQTTHHDHADGHYSTRCRTTISDFCHQ